MARRGAEDQTDPSKLARVRRAKSRSFAAGGARQSRAATDEQITGRGRTCRTGAWRSRTRTWCRILCKGGSGDGVRGMGWKSVASLEDSRQLARERVGLFADRTPTNTSTLTHMAEEEAVAEAIHAIQKARTCTGDGRRASEVKPGRAKRSGSPARRRLERPKEVARPRSFVKRCALVEPDDA